MEQSVKKSFFGTDIPEGYNLIVEISETDKDFDLAKNIDIDKLQDGVNSLSKAVGLFSDLFASKSTPKVDTYKPRAIYRRFED